MHSKLWRLTLPLNPLKKKKGKNLLVHLTGMAYNVAAGKAVVLVSRVWTVQALPAHTERGTH